MFCTLCSFPTPHLISYKLLSCRCTQCKQVVPYTCGEHVTRAMTPHNRDLIAAQKEITKVMAPAQFRTAMLLHLNLQPSEQPTLQKV
ncbi:hypothetical protein PHMEG_0002282 [Phytophthora megakarya]|uniref:Uncharacterized protein n=1 Tax=Phytophthora megakarya TaxID=4795 RepID=A0A225WZ47_9STRA|nr:hypothetical protein PHMEG_0002282 [Phytophthora megakarya]